MRVKRMMAVAALLSLVTAGHAWSAEQSPLGLWQALDDDTKQPSGWFLVAEHDGIYTGIIAKMFLKPGEDPNAVCDKCKDDRHNHPWLGLELIRGMKPDGDSKYDGGTILDPRDGKVYKAMMTLTPDGQTLVVRGYLGFALLGRNEYWTRLPDTDYAQLDPSVLPYAPPGAVPKHAPARKSGVVPMKPQNSARQ